MVPFKKYIDYKSLYDKNSSGEMKRCKYCDKILTLEELVHNNSDGLIEEAHNCNGYILYHGPNYVCIGTGFIEDSANQKTGAMIQITMIRSDMDPLEAIKKGSDATVCYDCAHRGKSCYVNVGRDIRNIYKAYTKGNYPFICKDPQNMRGFDDVEYYINNGFWELFSGRHVRFGNYGDPVRIPFPIVEKIAESCAGFTGYTHQWNKDMFSAYKKYFMASCDTFEEYQKAKEKGWRAFRVGADWRHKQPTEDWCKFSVDGTQCIDCLACSGTTSNEKDIFVKVHGASWKVDEFLHNFNDPSIVINLTPEELKQAEELEAREKTGGVAKKEKDQKQSNLDVLNMFKDKFKKN